MMAATVETKKQEVVEVEDEMSWLTRGWTKDGGRDLDFAAVSIWSLSELEKQPCVANCTSGTKMP